jgi:hypothetical protein
MFVYPEANCASTFHQFFLTIGTLENMLLNKKMSVIIPYAVESYMDLVSGINFKGTAETDGSKILSKTNIVTSSKCKVENKSLYITSELASATKIVQFKIKSMVMEENASFSLSIYTGDQKSFEYIFNGKLSQAGNLNFTMLGIIILLIAI